MPDTWEYPWFAAWDLAFHCIPLAVIDPQFAKDQLLLLGHEWYQHPNGQMPAYEWAFGDVNPPVQAWAALRVYQIEARVLEKEGDFLFLEKMFHKLLMNFTWWVNRKDAEGKNVFQGGFLGLDNIGLFDRSQPLPTGGYLEQSDGTSWMAMFCLNMLSIALELTRRDPSYEDMATKFFEHFIYIAHAMNTMGMEDVDLFDDAGRLLLRCPAPPRRRQRVPARPLHGRPDPPAGRGHHGRGPVRRAGRLPAAHRVVPRQPPRTVQERRRPVRDRPPRATPAVHRQPRPPADHPHPDARRDRVPVPPRPARRLALPPRPPRRHGRQGHRVPRGLRAGRVHHGPVRRQLQLARPRLVPPQLPAHRGPAKVRLLPRPRTSPSRSPPAPASP